MNGDPGIQKSFKKILSKLGLSKTNGSVSEVLEEILEERDENELPLDADEQVLLANILALSNITAEDVMVPRADINSVEVKTSYQELVEIFTKSGHSRLPVYHKSLDDVLGIVHIKDLVAASANIEQFKLKNIVRPVIFISPSGRALDILLKMRQKQTHMALVVDEYGGVDGLLTIEDVVEQIVGEIEDEHDVIEQLEMTPQEENVLLADARVELEDFEEWLGFILPDEETEEVDTVGGFVSHIAGRVPDRGEIIKFEDLNHSQALEFEILESNPRKLKRLRIRKIALQEEPKTLQSGKLFSFFC